MPRSDTLIKDDAAKIQHLNFDVSCDYKNCDEVATHRLVCTCGQFEFMCKEHAEDAKSAPRGSWIIFDKSCTHRVDMFDCRKEPI
jgi:hypothetical protein